MMSELTYIGHGAIPGIPARNLTAEEVKEYGGESFLISTGLYAKPVSKKTSKKEVKDG